MSTFPHNEWVAIDPELNNYKATHAMWVHGHALLRLHPYYGFAYDRDPLMGAAIPLPETKHVITPLVLVGQMSGSASEPWSTADGTRSWPGVDLETATEGLVRCAERFQNTHQAPDRRISRATLASWKLAEGKVVDMTPRTFEEDVHQETNPVEQVEGVHRANASRPRPR
jgi:hypothetical protein